MPSKNNSKPTRKSKKTTKQTKQAKQPSAPAGARISGRFEGNISAVGALHIDEGASCRANIRAGRVNVDGKFEGTMATNGALWIGNKGRCKGSFNAKWFQVDGAVEGQAVVFDRMDLSPTAAMKGHIVASRLVVADGASFDGRCTIGKFASEKPKARKAA